MPSWLAADPHEPRRQAKYPVSRRCRRDIHSGYQHLPKKGERDLFNIANSFAIRHNNPSHKPEYDRPDLADVDLLRLPRHDPRADSRDRT
jgi:hypothetical protein